MDERFQDRIDNYLLNRMDDVERTKFLCEVEQDAKMREQLEFTQNVKDSICSREEKLRALKLFQHKYEKERGTAPMRSKKKMWLWISGVSAVLVVGFFAIKPMFVYDSDPCYVGSPMEEIRGGDEVFNAAPSDSVVNDTIELVIEEEAIPNE